MMLSLEGGSRSTRRVRSMDGNRMQQHYTAVAAAAAAVGTDAFSLIDLLDVICGMPRHRRVALTKWQIQMV